MPDSLTAQLWADTFKWYQRNADGATQAMAAALLEIVNEIDDPRLGDILDALASTILKE